MNRENYRENIFINFRDIFQRMSELIERIILRRRLDSRNFWEDARQSLLRLRREQDELNHMIHRQATEQLEETIEISDEIVRQWNLISDLIELIERHSVGIDSPNV